MVGKAMVMSLGVAGFWIAVNLGALEMLTAAKALALGASTGLAIGLAMWIGRAT